MEEVEEASEKVLWDLFKLASEEVNEEAWISSNINNLFDLKEWVEDQELEAELPPICDLGSWAWPKEEESSK